MKRRVGRGAFERPKVFPIRVGGIVEAPIKPDRGVTKRRPSVVLQEVPPSSILVVGITSDGGEYDPANSRKYPPDKYIQIPHSADGSSTTGLFRASAAYADWVQIFDKPAVVATGGFLDKHLLDDLITKLQNYVRKTSSHSQ